MAENTIKVRQKQRYDTEANWKSKNPVLLAGEIAISSDKNGLMKVGDGKSLWTAIPYSKASLSKTDVTTALGYTPPTTNTTYSIGTSSTAGIVKLYTGTGSNTDGSMTQAAIKSALNGKSGTDHKHDLSTMINTLSTGTAVPTDADYFVSQYVGGGTTTTSYHRRPVSALWSYIKAKTDGLYQTKGSYAAASHKHGNADITSIDASKISSGTIDLARLPQGALERCVVVTDEAARLKLTTATVQIGDTVKVTATNKMYFVVDDTKLTSEAGYEVYTAGTATSVPWSGITGKPSTYPPSDHKHDLSTMINTLSTGTAVPTDADYFVSQYVGGGTTTTSYHRRPVSALWSYIKAKTDGLYQTKGSYAAASHKHGNADITSIDASKISSGTIDLARLPQGALERCVVVTDEAARLKLTTATVQIGDTVKVTATNKMYFVVDDTKLTSEAGYEVYTAGTATSVPWSGITGKPSTYPPSDHTHTYIIDGGNNASKTTLAYSKAGLGYSEYAWLAAWNGYELRAVNKNQFATSGHTHSQYFDSTTSRTANTFLAAPNGSNGVANFRKLVAADLPSHTHDAISMMGTNSVTAVANDTVKNWGPCRNSVHYFSKAGVLKDQPSQYGFVLNISNGASEVHQLWMTQASGNMAHRGANAQGWTGTWRTILDSSNVSSYALTSDNVAKGNFNRSDLTTLAGSDWKKISALSVIAYWNGRFNTKDSSLEYCILGKFGSGAVRNITYGTAAPSGSANKGDIYIQIS